MDPLLGAYAQRRRGAADPAAAMPDGMRRRLQTEVRRRWPHESPETGPNRSWFQALAALWPRLATAGGILAALIATFWWMSGPDSAPDLASTPSPEAAPEPGVSLHRNLADPSAASDQKLPASATQRFARDKALRDDVSLATNTGTSFRRAEPATTTPTDLDAMTLASAPASAPAPFPAPAPIKSKASEVQDQLPPPAPVRLADSTVRESVEEARPLSTRSRGAIAPSDRMTTVPAPVTTTTGTAAPTAAQRLALAPAPAAPAAPATLAAGVEARDGQTPPQGQPSQLYFRNVPPIAPGPAGPAGTTGPARASRPAPGGFARRGDPGRAPVTHPVLANFAFEQRGSTVRLIDADGSVYAGQIRSDGPATATNPTPATRPSLSMESLLKRRTAERRPVEMSTLAEAETSVAGAAGGARGLGTAESPLSVAFEVSGTNATLQQAVYLAGRLFVASTNGLQTSPPTTLRTLQLAPRPEDGASATAGLTPVQAGKAPAAGPEQPGSNVAVPVQVLRIQGLGRLGLSNELHLDAVPR